MASIFKRSSKKGAPYFFQWFDHTGKRRTAKGFTDRALTEQAAAKKEEEARLRKLGLIDPVQERAAEQKKSPLDVHLKCFELSLKKSTPKHMKLSMSRIRRLVSECGFESLADITRESVENSLRDMLEDDEIGHRTYNHYVQALDSFCNWCVETHRLIVSPIVGLERLNTEVDVRHPRRALKPEEIRKLIKSAFTSGIDIQCFSGQERAKIYILSYLTGLRRKEIASLTPRSFDLDRVPATVKVEAACSKHRREDVLPLHPALVVMVREWIDGRDPDAVLFPKLGKRRTWLMVKKDLERVGIPYETPDGIADFHAAGRHTHITELFRNGASVPEARQLARHSDIRQTMKYTHIGIEDQARAIGALPALQMRCISGVSDGQSVSKPGTNPEIKKSQNPCQGKGFDVDRRQLSPTGKVEAAGIEPASRDV